jgi:drug/metabolite transporter (DMT)-like permease
MFYILLAILASTAFGAGLKVSELAGRDRVVVAFVNYAAGAVMAAAYWALFADAPLQLSMSTVYAGMFAGIAWVVGLIAIMVSIKETGVALTTAISRLSVIVPIAACVLLWDEHLIGMEIAGVLLAVLAVLLLSGRAASRGGKVTAMGVILLVFLFISQAAAQISMKIKDEYSPKEEITAFMMVLFVTAAVLTGLLVFIGKKKLSRSNLLFGCALGLPNVLSGSFLLEAFQEVKGTIVYPVTSAGSVLLLALLGVFLWKEKLGRRAVAGILLTIAALVLINIGRGLKGS